MNLTKICYGGVPPFTEPVEFSFDEQVNLFVGTNATGKSSLASDGAISDRVSPPLAEGEYHRELELASGRGRFEVFRVEPELNSQIGQALNHLQPAGQPCKQRR